LNLGADRRKPRVCAVSYLNTVPLVWGMLRGAQRGMFDLEFRIPSECADRLASGVTDIGVVPSVEYDRLGLELIPGTGIASNGAVRSILLISKTEPALIRRLAADSSSRTSVALARIILARRYGNEPEVVSVPPNLAAMLEQADAALIIGDRALEIDPSKLPFHTKDLGEEWMSMTGLPMVFAVWAGRKGCVTPELAPEFLDSCRYGLANIDEIARTHAVERGLSEALIQEYFARNVSLLLGEREYAGLELFLRYAREIAVAQPGARVLV
jgi:chorismate dehydratase